MAYNLGDIVVRLKADTADLERGFSKANKITGSVGAGLKTLAKVGAIAGAAVAGVGVLTAKAYSESEDVIAQTNAILKSTGGIAGVTAEQVGKLSSSLQSVTKYSDETIQSGENMLLTFTNIGQDIFPQATETMLDMSQALGQDVKSSAIQLGKALQDPILGVTALRRVGVNFNDAQRDVIKNLVETGRSAEAQKLILKELQTEFGGSARAAGKTFAGSLIILKNKFNDLEESIGKAVVDTLTPALTAIADWANKVDWDRVINDVVTVFTTFTNMITSTYTALNTYLMPGIMTFIGTLKGLARILTDVLGPPLNALWQTIQDRLLLQLKNLWNAIEPGFTTALKIVATIVGGILLVAMWAFVNVLNVTISIMGALIRWFSNLIGWIGNVYATIINVVRLIIDHFGSLPGKIASFGAAIAGAILSPFKQAFNAIAKLWNSTVAKISFKTPGWVPGIGGKGFSVPKIPEFAKGIENFAGGLAYVHGGEVLTSLPRGTSVIPKDKVAGMMGNATNIYGNINIDSQADADYFFNRLDRNFKLESMGLSPNG